MNLLINDNIKKKIINFIFCLYPITFILGNTILNLNTLTLIIFSIFFFRKKIFRYEFEKFDWLILLLFIYVLIVMIINILDLSYFSDIKITHFENSKYYLTYKSIFFLRFIFLYFCIKFLILNKIINLKNFFLVCSFACIFVCIDILIQFFFNKDLFGLEPIHPRKLSGPFGPELIAGSYIQKFFPFIIFLILRWQNSKKKIFLSIVLILIFTSLIFSGNRMPLILSFFTIFLIFSFEKNLRKYFFTMIALLIIIFSGLYSSKKEIKAHYFTFYDQSLKILKYPFDSEVKRIELPSYFAEFESFYDTWHLNKYFGGGVRSFRIFCPYRKNIDIDERGTCNTHPHNYYLEILSELGLIGFSLVLFIFYKILEKPVYLIYKNKKNIKNNYILIPLVILFIIEIFPLKNTGSFFSTWNATYIFIIIGCLQSLVSVKSK